VVERLRRVKKESGDGTRIRDVFLGTNGIMTGISALPVFIDFLIRRKML